MLIVEYRGSERVLQVTGGVISEEERGMNSEINKWIWMKELMIWMNEEWGWFIHSLVFNEEKTMYFRSTISFHWKAWIVVIVYMKIYLARGSVNESNESFTYRCWGMWLIDSSHQSQMTYYYDMAKWKYSIFNIENGASFIWKER